MIKYNEVGECWEYAGYIGQNGYAYRNKTLIHREVFFMCNPDIPTTAHILHRCDNPPCIRPEHLFAGDQASNMKDMTLKGRHGKTKFTNEEILDIRGWSKLGMSQQKIADMYGVRQTTISRILLKQTWSHV